MIKLKDLLREVYIGSCVDVGNNTSAPICSIFSDATELDRVVNEGGNNIQVSPQTFYKYIDRRSVPRQITDGEVEYYRIGRDDSGNQLSEQETGLWWIYNVDLDVHYFFSRHQ